MGASLILNAARQLPQMKAVVVDSGPLIYVRKYFLYVLNNRRIRKRIARLCFLVTYLFFIGFYPHEPEDKKASEKVEGTAGFVYSWGEGPDHPHRKRIQGISMDPIGKQPLHTAATRPSHDQLCGDGGSTDGC